MTIENDNGLLINKDTNSVIGYLFDFTGRGVYSPDGKMEITPEQAQIHNKLLARAEIAGLDACAVGERGTFYLRCSEVVTWTGELVSKQVSVKGKQITFARNGRRFRGRLQRDADCFNFRRVY